MAAPAHPQTTRPATATTTTSQPSSSMSSPKDNKKQLPSIEDNQAEEHPAKEIAKTTTTTPPHSDSLPSISRKPFPERDTTDDEKAPTNAKPLAPPPRPTQQQSEGDYFTGGHNTAHFSLEPNPFEQSFGNPSSEASGRNFGPLPSVASLTSPAPLGPGGTPGWQLGNSLRSGPLSPAMLPGPTAPTGYFDDQFRQSFPTPNESSLRTGLTPGGGGSMFPAPSPNSQAIFNSIQSGGATPGTLDFHRTAMNAAARSKENPHTQPMGPTPQGINKQDYQPAQQSSLSHQDPFGNNPDRDAVNSLYMLAHTGSRNANQFAVPNQPQNVTAQAHHRLGPQDTSPTQQRGKQSIGSLEGSMAGISENGDFDGSDGSMDMRPAPKKGKKGVPKPPARRKADDLKAPPNKRSKGNNGNMNMHMDMSGDESDGGSVKNEMDDIGPNGKKMTDEEKRKNFLERNRVAALKCRQRKKQWLANLQAKVEIFTSENDALSAQNGQLRSELINLKTLLIAHKDCPVSHQQGMSGNALAQVIGADFSPNQNSYNMGMGQNGGHQGQMMQMHQGQGMQRS